MSGEVLVSLDEVTVAYEQRVILDRVNLKIYPGETVGLLGPNGAGKTSLLRVIAGLKPVVRGRVQVFGKDLCGKTGDSLRRAIGYVPQTIEVDPEFPASVMEVIMMGRWGHLGLFRQPGVEDFQVVHRVVQQLETEELLSLPFGHLSGGQRRRVLIARALAQEAKLLLLDEIFSWLDMGMKLKLLTSWRQVVSGKNITTILVSHELDLLKTLCNRLFQVEGSAVQELK
ncbi:MAG: ATP-binding cassette domain-containing protein [Candidatus Omnitrophica bacterium]|nr:ATP-binding cassette domain-containing protein [Candidatus Omnitrophota bacterium]